MSNVSMVRVLYHFESNGKKVGSEQYHARVIASAFDNASIKAVLTSNSITAPAGQTLVIDNIIHAGDGVS